jgi:hypothetical protein
MATRPPLQPQLSLFVATIIMVACAATGMLAGAFAHTLASKQSLMSPTGPVISGTAPGQAILTATPSSIAGETPTEPSTATGFTLNITVSSRSLSVGETFTVTVVASASGAPVAGLSCGLRAPISGPPGLFVTWPPAASTDASGQVIWTLTTPSVSPGIYGIEVSAVGSHRYEFHRYTTLRVA